MEARLKRHALERSADQLASDPQRSRRRNTARTGPAPWNWMVPMTEPSPWMRPAPREPSKQLNAKSLRVTNRRAASGLRLSAHAEPAASKVTTIIANRAITPYSTPRCPDFLLHSVNRTPDVLLTVSRNEDGGRAVAAGIGIWTTASIEADGTATRPCGGRDDGGPIDPRYGPALARRLVTMGRHAPSRGWGRRWRLRWPRRRRLGRLRRQHEATHSRFKSRGSGRAGYARLLARWSHRCLSS